MQNLRKYECEIAQDVILIDTSSKIRKILISDIVFLKTIKSYTSLRLCTSEEFFTSDSLASFEERLSVSFFRINRNTIINMSYVEKIQRKDIKHVVHLEIGGTFEISRRKVKYFIERFKQFIHK